MRRSLPFIIVFIVLLATLVGCRKSVRDLDDSMSAVKSYVLSEEYANDPFFWVHKFLSDPGALNDSVPRIESEESCVTDVVVTNRTGNPVTFTIKFSDNPSQECGDGRTRNGEINVKLWNGGYRKKGASLKIDATLFYLNNIEYQLSDSIINTGATSSGGFKFKSKIREAYLLSDTLTIEWNANKEWEWTQGYNSATYEDDVLEATGEVESLGYDGNTFTARIDVPLNKELSCKWIGGGQIELQPKNLSPRFVDYGNGHCNNDVDVTILKSNYEVTID